MPYHFDSDTCDTCLYIPRLMEPWPSCSVQVLLFSTASLTSLCYSPTPPVAFSALALALVLRRVTSHIVPLKHIGVFAVFCFHWDTSVQMPFETTTQRWFKSGWAKIFFFQWKCQLWLSCYTGLVKSAHVTVVPHIYWESMNKYVKMWQ